MRLPLFELHQEWCLYAGTEHRNVPEEDTNGENGAEERLLGDMDVFEGGHEVRRARQYACADRLRKLSARAASLGKYHAQRRRGAK